MNNVKFKAWDKQLKKIRSVFRIEWQKTGISIVVKDGAEIGVELYGDKKDEFILMPFTGLFDKNEKEIYGGYCLKWNEWEQELTEVPDVYVVVWDKESAGFVLDVYRDGKIIDEGEVFRDTDEFEIIGNIYENSNLITQ